MACGIAEAIASTNEQCHGTANNGGEVAILGRRRGSPICRQVVAGKQLDKAVVG